jgi:threonyl-tRNA synthetase
MMKDAQLTYRHLPVRMYEFAPSFRYEQSGELAGLRRLRGFWMPDVHSFCIDLQQGLEEYKELYRRYTELANGTGVNYAIAFRIVESFYKEHEEDILELLQFDGKPAMIELLSNMKHYWVMKHEINTIDFFGGVCQVSTVQLDIKDASLYGINYMDVDGQEKGCIIVHSSIGSPERWMYSILEDAAKHKPPSFPLWLAPTQVRILPVSDEKHLGFCLEIAEALKKERVRVDVDERSHPINWRIRAAEREWIPNIIVCGDKEMKSGQFLIRRRGGIQVVMAMDELVKSIRKETQGMPFKSLPGLLVSKRPVFRGRD